MNCDIYFITALIFNIARTLCMPVNIGYKLFIVAMQPSVDASLERLIILLDNSTVDSLEELRNCSALSEVRACWNVCLNLFLLSLGV